jgi:hypothetical protein
VETYAVPDKCATSRYVSGIVSDAYCAFTVDDRTGKVGPQ